MGNGTSREARWHDPETRQVCSPTMLRPSESVVQADRRRASSAMAPRNPSREHQPPSRPGNSGRSAGRLEPVVAKRVWR